MCKYLLIFIFLFEWSSTYCQQKLSDSLTNRITEILEEKLSGKITTEKFSFKGSPYLNKNWADGDILLINGKMVKHKFLKYNCYLDQVLWLRAIDNSVVELAKETIKEFYLTFSDNSEKICFRRIWIKRAVSNDSTNSFAQVLVDGKISFYVLRTVQIASSEYVHVPIYVIKKSDGNTCKIKLSRVALYKLFPEKKMQIKALIRKEKLKVRHEDSMKRAIQLLNAQLK